MELARWLDSRRARVDEVLEGVLPRPDGPAATISQAMRYSVLAGGKRLRPILACAAFEACGGDGGAIEEPAAALELLHTYSLIHDDLPAMDDDDLRRGRPTLHRAWSEAVAVLAGDALHSLAFEILSIRPAGDATAARRAAATACVARAAGVGGMVGGQIADLEAEGETIAVERLRWIHLHKTAALFAAAAEVGAIHAGASVEWREALVVYGRALGLAFQVADDLLDRSGSADRLGKTPGKDERAGKATYPALLGMAGADDHARGLVEEARDAVAPLGRAGDRLRDLARFSVSRDR